MAGMSQCLRSRITRVLAAGTIASSCSPAVVGAPNPTTAATAVPGGTVTIRIQGKWVSFNPTFQPAGVDSDIESYAYDRLIAFGPKGTLVPYLATSWKTTANSVTFSLRRDATCSDGTPVTPTVVASSFKWLFDPVSGAPGLAKFVGPGPIAITSDDSAGTVTFTSATPYSAMVTGFASPKAGIVICPAGIADNDRLKTQMFGSGPYTLADVVPGESVTLKLRPDWKWGPNNTTAATPGLPEKIVIQNVENPTTVANLLLTGGLDISMVSGPDVARLQASKSLIDIKGHAYNPDRILINQLPDHPTADLAVRQAVLTAIDRNGWLAASNDGDGVVATNWATSDVPCVDPKAGEALIPQPSIDKARAILQQAGWTLSNGVLAKGGKPLTLHLVAHAAMGGGPDYIADQLRKVGIVVNEEIADRATYSRRLVVEANFDILPNQANSPIPTLSFEPVQFLGTLPPKGQNFGRAVNPAAESAWAAALAAPSPSEACSAWSAMQKAVFEHVDWIPLTEPNVHWFSKGIQFTTFGIAIEPYSLRRVAP